MTLHPRSFEQPGEHDGWNQDHGSLRGLFLDGSRVPGHVGKDGLRHGVDGVRSGRSGSGGSGGRERESVVPHVTRRRRRRSLRDELLTRRRGGRGRRVSTLSLLVLLLKLLLVLLLLSLLLNLKLLLLELELKLLLMLLVKLVLLEVSLGRRGGGDEVVGVGEVDGGLRRRKVALRGSLLGLLVSVGELGGGSGGLTVGGGGRSRSGLLRERAESIEVEGWRRKEMLVEMPRW